MWAGVRQVVVGRETVVVPLELVSGFICEKRKHRHFLSTADTRLSPALYYPRPWGRLVHCLVWVTLFFLFHGTYKDSHQSLEDSSCTSGKMRTRDRSYTYWFIRPIFLHQWSMSSLFHDFHGLILCHDLFILDTSHRSACSGSSATCVPCGICQYQSDSGKRPCRKSRDVVLVCVHSIVYGRHWIPFYTCPKNGPERLNLADSASYIFGRQVLNISAFSSI